MSTFPNESPSMGRPQFHRTAAGDLPLDWTAQALGAHVRITSGESPSKFRFKGSGTPFFKIDQLNSDSKYLETTPYFFAGPQSVPAGSVVFPKRGASILLNKIRIFAADSYMDTNLMALTPITRIDSEFLYYTLEHLQLWRFADTASIPQINNKHVKPLPIPFPEEQEQRAIAAVLANVDSLLGKIDALLMKKRDLKQAAMQQLLSGEGRKGASTRSWCSASLGSMGSTYSGLAGKNKTHFGRGAARYIPFMNVMTNTVMDPAWTEPVDVAPQEVQTTVRSGDLLFNGSSETPEEVGYCSVVLTDVPGLYLNSFCFGFRFKQGVIVDGRFFAYWFRSSKGRDAMAVLAQGATRYNIAKSAFLRLSVPVPSVDEQREVADVLSDIDREIAMLVSRREKVISLKQAMMQQLLTGRIRLL